MVSRTSGTAVVISNSIDVTDRTGRILGQTTTGSVTKPTAFAVVAATNFVAGNVNISLGAGTHWIIKSSIIVTSAAAGNRELNNPTGVISSKLIGPSVTGDLLDREIALPGTAGTDLNVAGGVAGDSWTTSRLQVV